MLTSKYLRSSQFIPERINYKEKIEEGIPIIKEWLQQNNKEKENSEEYNELERVIDEIQKDNDYSEDTYLNIKFVLKPLYEQIPLKIKRIFNLSTMDHYTMFIASRWFKTIYDLINLEIGVKRFQGNMTKFHYNPVVLKSITRKFFPNLQTLYLYSPKANKFWKDETIIAREYVYLYQYLSKNEIKQLNEWTNMECNEILFDSDVDDWSKDTSVFDKKVFKQEQLIFLIEDEDGQKFGFYLDGMIMSYNRDLPGDDNSFCFNLQSNGRLDRPMKFEVLKSKIFKTNVYHLYPNVDKNLIRIGDIYLYKKNWKNQSFCQQDCFDYHNIEKAISGKCEMECINPKRILVIQLI